MRTKDIAYHDGNRILFRVDGVDSKTTMQMTVEGKRFDGNGSTSGTALTAAIAHNVANAIDGLGLDGDPAIAGLPKFLAALMAHHLHDCDSNWHEDWRAKAVCKIIDGYIKAIRKDE